MNTDTILKQIEESERICEKAKAYNGTDQDSIVDDPIWKCIVHSKDAFPRTLLQLRLLLPFVAHKPSCESRIEVYTHENVTEYGECDCGLLDALRESGGGK